ncbi:hypothetical protein [Bradyrhizobium sp. JR3.5]
MKFTIVFEGDIPPRPQSTLKQIHEIRLGLAPQIAELWKFEPLASEGKKWLKEPEEGDGGYATLERRGDRVFAPLVSKRNDMHCELYITFLRQQAPGQLISEGGDIDNRLKTFLDALSVPPHAQAREFQTIAASEPIFCLLQDDALVTKLAVETDRLLRPSSNKFDMVAVVQVHVKATKLTFGNIGIAG